MPYSLDKPLVKIGYDHIYLRYNPDYQFSEEGGPSCFCFTVRTAETQYFAKSLFIDNYGYHKAFGTNSAGLT